jgi:crossover junction endodeoxyribonuclease RuvC
VQGKRVPHMLRVLGIDPGASGALALIDGNGVLVSCHDMPCVLSKTGKRRIDPAALASIMQGLGDIDGAWIELVGPMPRDGSAGSFWFGKAAGLAEGVCAGLGVPCETVSPVVWKRRLDCPTDKHGARARATKLFGTGSAWPLAKHDGRAEAAMIALYGLGVRQANGGTIW